MWHVTTNIRVKEFSFFNWAYLCGIQHQHQKAWPTKEIHIRWPDRNYFPFYFSLRKSLELFKIASHLNIKDLRLLQHATQQLIVSRQSCGDAQEVRSLGATREEESRKGDAAHERRPPLALILTKAQGTTLTPSSVWEGQRKRNWWKNTDTHKDILVKRISERMIIIMIITRDVCACFYPFIIFLSLLVVK